MMRSYCATSLRVHPRTGSPHPRAPRCVVGFSLVLLLAAVIDVGRSPVVSAAVGPSASLVQIVPKIPEDDARGEARNGILLADQQHVLTTRAVAATAPVFELRLHGEYRILHGAPAWLGETSALAFLFIHSDPVDTPGVSLKGEPRSTQTGADLLAIGLTPGDPPALRTVPGKLDSAGPIRRFQPSDPLPTAFEGAAVTTREGELLGILSQHAGTWVIVDLREAVGRLTEIAPEIFAPPSSGTAGLPLPTWAVITLLILALSTCCLIAARRLIDKRRQSAFYRSPAKQDTMIILRGIAGAFAGQSLEITSELIVIGRSPRDASLVMPPEASRVSRRHCSLKLDSSGRVVIRDEGSTHGTFVQSGSRIGRDFQVLSPPCRIAIGDDTQVFEIDAVTQDDQP